MGMEVEDEIVTSSSSGAACKGESRWWRVLKRRVPVLEWGPRYSRLAALGDLVAGVTLGLTLVPQSIAYASLAGLPLHYGLYSSFMGTMVYCLVGTVKEVSIGPTSLMALLTLQTCRGLPLAVVPLLTLLSGLIVLAMGVLRLGFLVEFISPTVTSAFTSGTAAIIVFSQLKSLLGLSFVAESPLDVLQLVYEQRARIRVPDCVLSLGCFAVLLAMRKLTSIPASGRMKRALWLVSISRNALVVALASLLAYCTVADDGTPLFKLSGRVEPGLPAFSLPAFSVTADNNVTLPFPASVRALGAGVLVLPVTMVLANTAIAKAFASGRRMDATQEMVALGLCNVFGSLARAMPACGAFTRSALAASSGVRTPAAGLLAGGITLLALMFLTPYFYYIPRASLASVLICAVIFMIDVQIFGVVWRVSRREVLVLALTLGVACAGSVELCVIAGALADLALLAHMLATATLHTHNLPPPPQVVAGSKHALVARAPAWLVYCNVERVLRALPAPPTRALVLDLTALEHLDYAAIQALDRLAKKYEALNLEFTLCNMRPNIARILRGYPWARAGVAGGGEEEGLLAVVGGEKTDHKEKPQ